MPVDSETVSLGAQAPDFTLTAVNGDEVTLSKLHGKPVVLVFLRGFF
jgi:peroxiredoxin